MKKLNAGKPGKPSTKLCSTNILSTISTKIYEIFLFPTALGFFYLIVFTVNVSNFQLRNIPKMIS